MTFYVTLLAVVAGTSGDMGTPASRIQAVKVPPREDDPGATLNWLCCR
jgi:hypothetical protein